MCLYYIGACAGDRVGLVPTGNFASTSATSQFMTANGTWLDLPSAVLIGTDGNTTRAVLLSLGNPSYDILSKVNWSTQHLCMYEVEKVWV